MTFDAYSLEELLTKAEKFGFYNEEINRLAEEYDIACRDYVKHNPAPKGGNIDAACAWIDKKHETAYLRGIKKLYSMIDEEQRK